jgi:hypothetical protein
MIEVPQIARTVDQHTAIIRLTIPRAQIQTVMGPGIAELMATIAAQGIAPADPGLLTTFGLPQTSSTSRSAYP